MNAMELSWAIEGLFRLFDWNLIIDSELSNYAYEFEAADKKGCVQGLIRVNC